ncbi:hypothetical protein PC129_g16158 [Phytophthora cactorum]|uniref:Uncharacterized protein n=1 Tax=Phytophthora cactorum TaxID=29920 RepID=A0A329S319_9STRA|nr:hypothetical protein Pcac1_g21012 [Phytophthora cactorum]KAG3212891.1 hypothetical protein PC129_g16158 [Phytophthora cactorum]RAW31095.1 hypothetical protein PC110_g12557 [Phytophthora cactorum]
MKVEEGHLAGENITFVADEARATAEETAAEKPEIDREGVGLREKEEERDRDGQWTKGSIGATWPKLASSTSKVRMEMWRVIKTLIDAERQGSWGDDIRATIAYYQEYPTSSKHDKARKGGVENYSN